MCALAAKLYADTPWATRNDPNEGRHVQRGPVHVELNPADRLMPPEVSFWVGDATTSTADLGFAQAPDGPLCRWVFYPYNPGARDQVLAAIAAAFEL